jgi:sortase A
LVWLQRLLLVLGVILLALWLVNSFISDRFQSSESERLGAALLALRPVASGASAGPAASGGLLASSLPGHQTVPGDVLGRLEIPRLQIGAIVAEGSDPKTLGHAVGHISFTARPGRPGNCALAGHRDSFLRGLGHVRVNDVIHIVTLERTYTYRVEWTQIVEPKRVDLLDSTSTRSLTLITCYPFVFVGHAPKRFVVRARQV